MIASDDISVREMAYGSHDYAQSLRLREEILRKPLGLTLDEEDTEDDSDRFHLGAFSGGMLLACLVLVPRPDRTVQMRQVAVDSARQGHGIGRQLVLYAEDFARNHGYDRMILHARMTAFEFYHKMGYQASGDEFIENTVPHIGMEKRLQAQA